MNSQARIDMVKKKKIASSSILSLCVCVCVCVCILDWKKMLFLTRKMMSELFKTICK